MILYKELKSKLLVKGFYFINVIFSNEYLYDIKELLMICIIKLIFDLESKVYFYVILGKIRKIKEEEDML